MSKYKVNDKGTRTAVAFNGSAEILANRDADTDVLAEIAVYSNDQTLIGLFEKLPTIEEWEAIKGKEFVENQPPRAEAQKKV